MKNHKKIWLALLVVGASLFGLATTQSAFALSNTPVSGASLNLSFKDRSTISGTVNGVALTYVDKDPLDTTYNYVIQQDGIFCSPGGNDSNITILNDNIALASPSASVKARFDVTVSKDATEQGCSGQNGTSINFSVGNPSAGMNYFQWAGGKLQSLDGTLFTEIGTTDVYESNPNGSCGGGAVAVINGGGATLYELDKTGATAAGRTAITYPSASNFAGLSSSSLANGCYAHSINGQGVTNSDDYKKLASQKFGVSGERKAAGTDAVGTSGSVVTCDPAKDTGCVCSSQGCTSNGVTTTTDTSGSSASDSCAQSNVFAWLICPALDIAQMGANGLIKIFESQLSFTVNDLGQGSGGSNSVHTAWSLIRTISSIALVLVMLVMVLSQATSWGSIDAYTVRKMLPRLVVAVILIQISWNMFGFMLLVVNDISKGLADLMYYPFGGSANMDLGSLLNNAHIGTGGANSDAWAAGLIGLGLLGTILGVAAAPAVLGFVVTAVFALLTGLVALMFRKILIIACLIFSPLALLLWILPGTQKYWKLWWDNFTKALMMFPIVVAIVASGRIFAWVAGTQNTSAAFSVLLNFIIVMVGFFGPLFILPKTFKWGGSLMNSAGSTIQNTIKPLSEMSSKGAHGYGERLQGRIAKSYNPDKDAKGNGGLNRFARRVGAGNPNIFSPRSQNLAIQKGDKWNSEEDELATGMLKRMGEKAQDGGYETAIRDDEGNLLSAHNLVQDTEGNYLNSDGEIAYKKQTDGSYKEIRDGVEVRTVMDASGNLIDEDGKITHEKQADGSYIATDTKEVVEGASALSAHFSNAMHQKASDDEKASGQVHKRTLYGVAAMKQMWVDLANDPDKHISKMAIRQLTATSSWPELQGSFTKDGKKVMDTKAWKGSITTSPEDYPRVLRSRVDAAPHLVTAAEAAARAKGLKEDTPAFRSFVQAKRMELAITKQMSNEDFQTQSDGFWEDAARLAEQRDPKTGDYTSEAKQIRRGLKERFVSIAAAGGTAPQQMLGHLVGGSVQSSVDKVLGSGVSVVDFLSQKTDTGGAGNPATIWKETLPPATDITVTATDTGNLLATKEETRANYKGQLLNKANPRAADALSQGIVYADQMATVKDEELDVHFQVLRELHDSSMNSPETAPLYNGLIQKVRTTAQARIDEEVRKAVADGLPASEVERVRQTAQANMSDALRKLPPLIPGYDTPRLVRPGTTPPPAPPIAGGGGDLVPGDEVEIGGHPI